VNTEKISVVDRKRVLVSWIRNADQDRRAKTAPPPRKKKKRVMKFNVLKYWMFSLESYRLLFFIGRPSWRPGI
jgi:hypothetical protein